MEGIVFIFLVAALAAFFWLGIDHLQSRLAKKRKAAKDAVPFFRIQRLVDRKMDIWKDEHWCFSESLEEARARVLKESKLQGDNDYRLIIVHDDGALEIVAEGRNRRTLPDSEFDWVVNPALDKKGV